MFDIKFRITDDIEMLELVTVSQFDMKYCDVSGCFRICIGNGFIGSPYEDIFYPDLKGDEWLGGWFYALFGVIRQLESGNYAAFSALSFYRRWAEFVREGDMVRIRCANDQDKENFASFINEPYDKFEYIDGWECTISFSQLKDKVRSAAEDFLEQFCDIKPLFRWTMLSKNIIENLEKL